MSFTASEFHVVKNCEQGLENASPKCKNYASELICPPPPKQCRVLTVECILVHKQIFTFVFQHCLGWGGERFAQFAGIIEFRVILHC